MRKRARGEFHASAVTMWRSVATGKCAAQLLMIANLGMVILSLSAMAEELAPPVVATIEQSGMVSTSDTVQVVREPELPPQLATLTLTVSFDERDVDDLYVGRGG